ncbi:MAG: hypothetical protein WA208_10865 [Thermoanaerobaculia bacterium]
MPTILFRLGLWTLILVLGLYVLRESNSDQSWAILISGEMLVQALLVSAALIVAGIVAKVLGKGATAMSKNRCTVCRKPVPPGAIYCRAHLRSILHEEDDRRHQTTNRR